MKMLIIKGLCILLLCCSYVRTHVAQLETSECRDLDASQGINGGAHGHSQVINITGILSVSVELESGNVDTDLPHNIKYRVNVSTSYSSLSGWAIQIRDDADVPLEATIRGTIRDIDSNSKRWTCPPYPTASESYANGLHHINGNFTNSANTNPINTISFTWSPGVFTSAGTMEWDVPTCGRVYATLMAKRVGESAPTVWWGALRSGCVIDKVGDRPTTSCSSCT